MPRETMLYANTRNVATVLGMADTIGSIEAEKRGDFPLVDLDLLRGLDNQIDGRGTRLMISATFQ